MTEKEREQEKMSKDTDDLQRAFEEGWEISEDDFEETQDLTKTAACLSDKVSFSEEGEYEEKPVDQGAKEEKLRSESRSHVDRAAGKMDWDSDVRKGSAAQKGSAAGKRSASQNSSAAGKHSTLQNSSAAHRNSIHGTDPQKKKSPGNRKADSGRRDRRTEHVLRGHTADRPRKKNRRQENGFLAFLKGLSAMDRVIGLTGAAVCLFAVFTFSFVLAARAQERQVASFASVGEQLSRISVADESTFLAVADSVIARQQAAEYVETEYEEKDEASEIQVGLNMTSVEKDLKIKFVNRETGKLIPYVAFEVKITGPDKSYEKTDDDEDGIIYLTGITGGSYTVEVTGPEGLEEYVLPKGAQSVSVKSQIAYEKIDVADEIKSESEVNAAAEDTEIKTQVESVLQDTVEWVESTRTPIGDEGSLYIEVKKEDIPDPSQTAALSFALFAGVREDGRLLKTSAAETSELQTLTEAPPTETETQTTENTSPSEETPDPPTETDTQAPSVPETVTVTGVSASPSSLSGKVGESGDISVTVSPDNASNKGVSFSSDNAGVAEVDSSGHVSFKGAGSAAITVKTNDGGYTASVSVNVSAAEKKVDSVSISGDSIVTVGSSISLSASVSPSDAAYSGISWSSSNAGIATVDNGKVTGVAAGKVTITAEAGGVKATKEIEVKAAEVTLTGIKIAGSASAKKGETVQLSITAEPSGADASVTWSSSNADIASVDGNGKVTCSAVGSTTITAVSRKNTNIKDSITFTVTSDESNSVTLNEMKITAGQTKAADVKITGNVSSSSFSIANTKYATVDGNGNIKAIRAGSTELTVKVDFSDGSTQTKTAKLTIEAAEVKGITLDQTKVTLKVGESLKLNPTIDTTGYTGCLWYTSDSSVVTVTEHGNGTITAVKAGKVTITACSSEDTSKKATCEVTVTGGKAEEDTKTLLKDKDGRQLYILKDGKYVEAVVADYFKYDVFYRLNDNVEYKYTGWQTIDGKRYYFDKNGNKVTGTQIIQGVQYDFGEDGALSSGSGVLGIDVSKHNGSIDWEKVKNSGVSFVIIRCGYRGSATGVMVEDPKFKSNIQGATAAGLKVGVYYFSQAVNRVEAVEEASAALDIIAGYKISYPVFIDVEAAGGRADGISSATRTEVVQAFCETIRDSGYTAGVYANKTWLGSKMSTGSFSGYNIWLAQYAAAPTYNGRYEMWQYSSTGKIDGISGNVDLNISYLGY